MFKRQKNKKKLNANQTKQLIPVIKHFNKIAKVFVGMLAKQVEAQEAKNNKIKVLVNDFKMPQKNHNIMIHTIDLNETKVKKKGDSRYNQKMSWEEDVIRRNKGLLL